MCMVSISTNGIAGDLVIKQFLSFWNAFNHSVNRISCVLLHIGRLRCQQVVPQRFYSSERCYQQVSAIWGTRNLRIGLWCRKMIPGKAVDSKNLVFEIHQIHVKGLTLAHSTSRWRRFCQVSGQCRKLRIHTRLHWDRSFLEQVCRKQELGVRAYVPESRNIKNIYVSCDHLNDIEERY